MQQMMGCNKSTQFLIALTGFWAFVALLPGILSQMQQMVFVASYVGCQETTQQMATRRINNTY